MSEHKTDADLIQHTRNTSRFFVENRQIGWVLLVGVLAWGTYGYLSMPQRKDPEIPVRVAVALTPWPGSGAERVEQLVTRAVESRIAENTKVSKVESISKTGLSVVFVELDQKTKETGKEFDDIKQKLDDLRNLPPGAGPVNFVKDFGDTTALMLTVASPKLNAVEMDLLAGAIRQAIQDARSGHSGERVSFVLGLPPSISPRQIREPAAMLTRWLMAHGAAHDAVTLERTGFVLLDFTTGSSDEQLTALTREFVAERFQQGEIHPDVWMIGYIRDPVQVRARLASVAADKYSYRQMNDFTDLIERTLKTSPLVSKTSRAGLLDEAVFLFYSQERLAAYGAFPVSLENVLRSRNTPLGGGALDVRGKELAIDPSGEFRSEAEIGDVLVPVGSDAKPVHLRDLVEVVRGYNLPARYLNYFTRRDASGNWQRTRAITLAVQMRSGEQISAFGHEVDHLLEQVKARLPEDLIMARTSDQPRQVHESVDLFMHSLYEAIILVVIISLIGFWEWRSSLLMALSIPVTLAMTFGMMHLLGIDLQQISIASLIIALGLLVDDPVVAGDAIKRDLAEGHPRSIAAWLGPTKLATAILFATATNIVAYLPFLSLPGDNGRFLYSLPVVLTCSLVASRLVSMSFVPMLGYYLLKAKHEPSIEERRRKGFPAFYYRVGGWAIEHRWKVAAAAFAFLVVGGLFFGQLKQQLFPKDLSYLSYVDVWLPEDAPLSATNATAAQVENVVAEVAARYGREHPASDGKPHDVLKSITTFVGGGGPRFWFSVTPELQQLNYAQVLIEVRDKHDTDRLLSPLQHELSRRIAGARVDVRRLETGAAIGLPVAFRIAGDDIPTLRAKAEELKSILRSSPLAESVRDDWGDESFSIKLRTDPERANLAGVSNLDIAQSSVAGMTGYPVTALREGDKQIPVVVRLKMEERSRLEDVQNLYVFSQQGGARIPLRQVSTVDYDMRAEKLRRRDQFRAITVGSFTADGVLPSEVVAAVKPKLAAFEHNLPPGFTFAVAGEQHEQDKSFGDLMVVLLISVVAIFIALVFQFRSAVKPLLVFAAIPFGAVGAGIALWIMGSPFGFMAFLGVISLVGVIVSHVIVLFDFIEEAHERGRPFREALLDAGILRLRPVLITVGATVFALFPLAINGGPLWQPMCYAQIGGLTIATVVTLLLVPVFYAIFVFDLKIVKWESRHHEPEAQAAYRPPGSAAA